MENYARLFIHLVSFGLYIDKIEIVTMLYNYVLQFATLLCSCLTVKDNFKNKIIIQVKYFTYALSTHTHIYTHTKYLLQLDLFIYLWGISKLPYIPLVINYIYVEMNGQIKRFYKSKKENEKSKNGANYSK